MPTTVIFGKRYTIPRNPEWHDGPPPAEGWWPASHYKNASCLRFWDGEAWSLGCDPGDPMYRVAFKGARRSPDQTDIRWCARWWE